MRSAIEPAKDPPSTEALHTSGSPLFDLFVLHAEIALAFAVDAGLLDKEKVRHALRLVGGE